MGEGRRLGEGHWRELGPANGGSQNSTDGMALFDARSSVRTVDSPRERRQERAEHVRRTSCDRAARNKATPGDR